MRDSRGACVLSESGLLAARLCLINFSQYSLRPDSILSQIARHLHIQKCSVNMTLSIAAIYTSSPRIQPYRLDNQS